MQLLVTDALRRAERLFGQREAIACGEVRLSYAAFASRCRRLATVLRQLGVKKGDRVATLMSNCHRYLEVYFAIPGVGAVLVPLNNRHAVPEHRAILQDAGVRLLLIDETYCGLADALASTVSEVLLAPQDYERMVARSVEDDLQEEIGEEDLAALFYTGGTTGVAKGVMLTHRNLVANAFHITIAFAYQEGETFLHAAPMFHLADGGSVYALTWRGARHAFVPAFEPGVVLAMIARERVHCTIGVPTMVHALVNHPRTATTDLRSLRLVAHGGAPISTELLRQAHAMLGCSFTQAYGLTESSSLASVLPREEYLPDDFRLRSVGQAVMGVELVVRRPDGTICEPGEVGEITGRGPNFTPGYWGKPQQTAEALRDGWFWTGDLGYMDPESYLYIVDRIRDMVISGGENVYSVEVEAAVRAHPAVLEAAVIGIPDETWGERVHAVVVKRPGHDLDAETLRAFCKERIAGYKCPRSVEFRETLPKSGAGKVLKRELRALYRVGATRQAQ